MKTVINLNHNEAKDFFMKHESYTTLPLPKYIDFSSLLIEVEKKLNRNTIEDIKEVWPSTIENINFKVIQNKNDKYDWREIELIHPVLYVALINDITEKTSWDLILKNLESESYIEVTSLPIVSETKESDNSEQISSWYRNFELKTIELSIKFDSMFHTDITGCYSEIYTHSIPWAIHTKDIAKKNQRNKKLLGNKIDKLIQGMSYGQTNGIPQGSVLMDFIAEIVLNYADRLLTDKIKKNDKINSEDFKILRYRDDYRILINIREVGEEILRELSKVLMGIGLKLNSKKTKYFENIIVGSMKEDKLEWMSMRRETSVLNKLLVLQNFSIRHKNSGILFKELKNISQILMDDKNKEHISTIKDIPILISILSDIALNNPKVYPKIIQIFSLFLDSFECQEKKKKVFEGVIYKFRRDINSDILNIWLQRMVLKYNFLEFKTDNAICKLVLGNFLSLWNNKWLKEGELKNIFQKVETQETEPFPKFSLEIKEEELAKIPLVIEEEEIDMFLDYN
jgi:hypothetical protein